MDKVTLHIKKGEAVISKGKDSFIGKLIASANRVKIHKPGVNREVRIVEPTKTKKK